MTQPLADGAERAKPSASAVRHNPCAGLIRTRQQNTHPSISPIPRTAPLTPDARPFPRKAPCARTTRCTLAARARRCGSTSRTSRRGPTRTTTPTCTLWRVGAHPFPNAPAQKMSTRRSARHALAPCPSNRHSLRSALPHSPAPYLFRCAARLPPASLTAAPRRAAMSLSPLQAVSPTTRTCTAAPSSASLRTEPASASASPSPWRTHASPSSYRCGLNLALECAFVTPVTASFNTVAGFAEVVAVLGR